MIDTARLAATLAATLAACGGDSTLIDIGAERAPAPAAERSSEIARPEFVGVVTTKASVVVASEFEGRIERLFVRPGQRVTKGEPIAEIDDRQVRKQLAAARAAEQAARAEVGRAAVEIRVAKRQMTLERRLYRRGAVARERIRKATADRSRAGAEYGAAAAGYRKAVAERQQLEQHLERATLVAPIDGVVSMIRVKEGEIAQPGVSVARVFDPRDLRLRFAVDQRHRDAIKEGVTVIARLDDGRVSVKATIDNVSSALEPPLQFLVADADIDDTQVTADAIDVGVVGSVTLAGPEG